MNPSINGELDRTINSGQVGAVVLPTVLVLGLIIIGLVLTGAFVVQFLNRSNFAIRLTTEATAAAQAALADFHLKLVRRSPSPLPALCNDASPTFSDQGNFSLGRTTVKIEACHYNCGGSPCRYRVRAEAKAFVFLKRLVEGVFDVDPVSGQVRISAIKNLEF